MCVAGAFEKMSIKLHRAAAGVGIEARRLGKLCGASISWVLASVLACGLVVFEGQFCLYHMV